MQMESESQSILASEHTLIGLPNDTGINMTQRVTVDFVDFGEYDGDILRVTVDGKSRCETRKYWLDHIIHHGTYKIDDYSEVPSKWRTQEDIGECD